VNMYSTYSGYGNRSPRRGGEGSLHTDIKKEQKRAPPTSTTVATKPRAKDSSKEVNEGGHLHDVLFTKREKFKELVTV